MVAYKGVIATAVAAGGVANQQPQGWIDGRVKCMIDQIVLAGSELSGSTISLGAIPLPDNSTIIAILLSSSVAQTSLTASVGDAGSGTRYATASTGLQTANSLVQVPGKGYVTTGTSDTQLVLTTGGATATAGTITSIVLFTHD